MSNASFFDMNDKVTTEAQTTILHTIFLSTPPTSSQLPLLLLARGVAVVELLLLSRDLITSLNLFL